MKDFYRKYPDGSEFRKTYDAGMLNARPIEEMYRLS